MSGFKALNVEDDDSDSEVDNTAELQVEDALVLYQDALQHHAAGPAFFDKAAEAYEKLFQSEIFKYAESQTELHRIELYGPATEADLAWEDGLDSGIVLAPNTLDTGPSTLQQILHLSHKNYAQFRLDALSSRLSAYNSTLKQVLNDAAKALEHFVEALDKDETDTDLWQRTATVSAILDSKRVARFCLEAVLDGDEDGLGSVFSLPGLEESVAGEKLLEVIGRLEDDLSVMQKVLPEGTRHALSKMLKKRLSCYETITSQVRDLRVNAVQESHASKRAVLTTPTSWANFGEIILRQRKAEQEDTGSPETGVAIGFNLDPNSHPEIEMSIPESSKLTQTLDTDLADRNSPSETTIGEASSTVVPVIDEGPSDRPGAGSHTAVMKTTMESEATVDIGASITLPSRKRSVDMAGLREGQEDGRSKSKRTRARDSTLNEDSKQAIIDANVQWEYEQQLNEFQAADDWMYETVGSLFEKIGVVGFEAARYVRQELQPHSNGNDEAQTRSPSGEEGLDLAKIDLQSWLENFSDQLAQVLLVGGESLDATKDPYTPVAGGSVSNESGTMMQSKSALISDDGLSTFLKEVNSEWLLTQQVAWRWLCKLLRPHSVAHTSTYCEYLWPEHLKTMVVRTLVTFDESIFNTVRIELENFSEDAHLVESCLTLPDFVQAVFEIHLDIYSLIKQSNSGVDVDTIDAQRDRLSRWADLAREVMRCRAQASAYEEANDELDLRHLWATTFHIDTSADVTQNHVIECMKDLLAVFTACGGPTIRLQNNAVMPELSIAALNREISLLTTKDFFIKVTSQDTKDPVAIIESLEPLLECLAEDSKVVNDVEESGPSPGPPSSSSGLVRFLKTSDVSVRLMLWQRLRDAYLAIDYKPMIISCYFKMIHLLLSELKRTVSTSMSRPDRQVMLLKSFRIIKDITMKALTIMQSCETALECIDGDGLNLAISDFGQVLQLVQVFNVFEDSHRVGQSQPPSAPTGLPSTLFANTAKFVHEIQVHTWTLLYRLLKEAISQNHDLFLSPAEDMFDFLRVVHRNLGLRGICGTSDRIFVRMLMEEFFQMTHVESYESEQAQVLYDLYGLNCFLNPSYELIEHKCVHDSYLDRSVAMRAVDLLIQQANKLPMRDLIKHPIKETIDKVHGAAPRKKPTEAILRNRDISRAFLRSAIHPLDLYSCLQGDGNHLTGSFVPKEDALLGSKGWYFLMGHIALAKFRAQKRTTATQTEEVDIAIAFFMQDLEYSMDNWETWFRLAQAYDTKIEESVVWSAEKLNNSMSEVVQLQRAAIHCYVMATALAFRTADLALETSEKMTELFIEFATRMYASSREPFSMLPFGLDDTEKFFSPVNQNLAKGKPFQPLRVCTAWKLAKVLYQKALAGRPQSWHLHFMLGKCLWKMHAAPPSLKSAREVSPPARQVLDSFIRAIELLPDKKDSREKKEPTLEPHYKLVSVVHKMLVRQSITLDQAKEALTHTPYGRTDTAPQELDEWVPHILSVLKSLRAADKSNWHHRIVARVAHIIYEDSDVRADVAGPSHNLGAMRAKHELTQQMFTKTMVLQVWRPECERASRHFVYTARYTRFFVRILEQLKDRISLEQLAKRVRKRPHEIFEHGLVWQEICNAYLRLLRNYADLPEGLEMSTFSTILYTDFVERRDPLEKWMQAQEPGAVPALDVLRDVQELKKVNASLMKAGSIDDLIGDAYAYLFNTAGKQLLDEERRAAQEREEVKKAAATAAATINNSPRNPMMSLQHLMNTDGADDTKPSSSEPQPPAPTNTVTPALKRSVGRREVRTCAEACFQKAPATTATAPSLTSRPSARVEVIIPSSTRVSNGPDISMETSAPGSIHDDADDESELSELEEEEDDDDNAQAKRTSKVEAKPMFPGLVLHNRDGSEEFESAQEEQLHDVVESHEEVSRTGPQAQPQTDVAVVNAEMEG